MLLYVPCIVTANVTLVNEFLNNFCDILQAFLFYFYAYSNRIINIYEAHIHRYYFCTFIFGIFYNIYVDGIFLVFFYNFALWDGQPSFKYLLSLC